MHRPAMHRPPTYRPTPRGVRSRRARLLLAGLAGAALSSALVTTGAAAQAAPAVQAAPAAHAGPKPSACRHLNADPYTTYPVPRCVGTLNPGHRVDLGVRGTWYSGFEPTLRPVTRPGWYFVYIGDVPMGWVQMTATEGGTFTLSFPEGSYTPGVTPIALYDTHGKLAYWDTITLGTF